ncbi:MAG: 23S rRNA (guanosine(2251)-2'-O)-methyltransferase RlmB [Deltaproteobacteria bacterium]|nr:23S rRNA (guanosine(2251)-2'-O)-methyltransferase RlmB [Deltaproteobacteria bacterium]
MGRPGKGKPLHDKNLLYGITPVLQCLTHRSRKCHQLLLKDGSSSPRVKELERLAQAQGISVQKLDGGKLASLTGSKLHQGVALSCGDLMTHDLDEFIEGLPGKGRQLLIAMDQVEDPQNLGAVIRSAAFLGAMGLISLKKHAAPLSATVSKVSAGSLEHFPMIQVGNLSESLLGLKKEGFIIAGAAGDEEAIPFHEMPLTERMVLVMGNEGQGLRNLTRRRCDFLIRIPGNEAVESLNVSAAASILIHHLVMSN